MKKVLTMTVHNRTEKTLWAVYHGMAMPGNEHDKIVICMDRAGPEEYYTIRSWNGILGAPLDSIELKDKQVGQRCPSRAWNKAFSLVDESHAFCISSDVVLAPHSIGMAYQLARAHPDAIICGRAEHCGQSYKWSNVFSQTDGKGGALKFAHRMMTWHMMPHPLGFCWLLPMKYVRQIGGYDEIFMDGLCYEDDDFAIRMWNAGADIVFCDDIVGFHLEHPREYLKDTDGRVKHNEQIFLKRYGRLDYIKSDRMGGIEWNQWDVPNLSMWLHREDVKLIQRIATAQQQYGVGEPWRAVIPRERNEKHKEL